VSELVCRWCGFVTHDFEDMCKHLAQWRRNGYVREDGCNLKIINMRKDAGVGSGCK